MALIITDPKIIQRGPYCVVGSYAVCRHGREAWGEAAAEFDRRRKEIPNRRDDTLLAFLYRPHKDDPSVGESVRSCFMGVEVADLTQVPQGMAATQFTGGKYVTVECRGDTENEAAMGVGDAIGQLEKWIPENGFREGDACFCFSREGVDTAPFVQHVYSKLEQAT